MSSTRSDVKIAGKTSSTSRRKGATINASAKAAPLSDGLNTSAYATVDAFERTIAEYAGAKYAVAVESCTAALFLCCVYRKVQFVSIPKFTYPGVACSIIHAGGKVIFNDYDWRGIYHLSPYKIYDAALRFHRGMFSDMKAKGSLMCLSFHAKKILAIGRGGMILTDDKKDADWFKRARFDGRGPVPLKEDKITSLGWNMYLSPEQAARGLMLFEAIKDTNPDDLKVKDQNYIDLSTIEVYSGKTKSGGGQCGRRNNRKAG